MKIWREKIEKWKKKENYEVNLKIIQLIKNITGKLREVKIVKKLTENWKSNGRKKNYNLSKIVKKLKKKQSLAWKFKKKSYIPK